MFSTLKYVNAPNFEKFRQVWSAEYLGGFIIHSLAFDGLKGDFPIGFLIWKTIQSAKKKIEIEEIVTEVLDKNCNPIGVKSFYNLPTNTFLNPWVKRPKVNKQPVVPLKNAVSPATRTIDVRGGYWSDNAIGSLYLASNDIQNAKSTSLYSSGFNGAGAFFVNSENLWQVAIIFSVRKKDRKYSNQFCSIAKIATSI